MARTTQIRMVAGLLVSLHGLLAFQSMADDGNPNPVVPRVVVQDTRLGYLDASPDGRILVGHGEARGSRHIFHAIDIKTRKTVLMLHLPQRITDVAVAPQNGWFAVAAEKTIYRVDILAGDYEVLLEDVTGQVALNAAGDRLAVLGAIDFEGPIGHLALRGEGTELGIYDLEKKKWLAKCKTPILIDQDVWFEEDQVVAYGRGGRIFNRRASSFRCDVRLSPTGDEPILNAGRETFRGDPVGDGYVATAGLAGRKETHEAAKELLKSLRETLSPDRIRNPGLIFPPVPNDAAERTRPTSPNRQRPGGLLNIGRDGAISTISTNLGGSRGVHLMDGRLVQIAYQDNRYDVFAVSDLWSGESVLAFPYQPHFYKISTGEYWLLPLSNGLLVHQPSKLAFYRPSKPAAVWEKPFDLHVARPYPCNASRNGAFIFWGGRDKGPLATILSATTGKAVCEIDRESGQSGYAIAGGLNDDGSEVALIVNNRLQINSVLSGKKIHDEELPSPSEAFFRYVAASGDKWIIGSESAGSRILDLDKETTVSFSLPEAFRASPIQALGRECLLIETQLGKGGIVDVETGDVHAEWYVGTNHEGGSRPEGPPRVATAFNGKLLVRRKGQGAEMELIDLRTLDTVATVYFVPVESEVGWIAATPDGFWDASPGAERFVEIYSGHRNLAGEKRARRKPQRIKDRIASVISR